MRAHLSLHEHPDTLFIYPQVAPFWETPLIDTFHLTISVFWNGTRSVREDILNECQNAKGRQHGVAAESIPEK